MKTLTNQTIYQCEYCGKRLLSKNGAKIHEEDYCHQSPIRKQKRLDIIMNCEHEWDTVWTPMFGESHLKEPDHDECIKCGVLDLEWHELKKG
jgi:DNA-directed RNA polymerase subunit RPC12/RpoP